MSEYETDTIKGIEPKRKKPDPIKRVEFLRKEERLEALQHPARIQILQILKEGIDDTITTEEYNEQTKERVIRQTVVKRHILSLNEIIKTSKEREDYTTLTKNQVYHHIPEMIKANLIELYGVLKKGGRETNYYRRTADNFVTFGLHYGAKGYREAVRAETEKSLSLFNLKLSKEEKQQFLDIAVKSELMKLEGAETVERLVSDDITDSKAIEMLDWFLWVYATGKKEYCELLDEVRKLIFKDSQ